MERSAPTTARSNRPDAVEYAARAPGRFHVPGHKGGAGADAAMVEALGATALEHDIPALIEGIDAGPEPTPFTRAQQLAASAQLRAVKSTMFCERSVASS